MDQDMDLSMVQDTVHDMVIYHMRLQHQQPQQLQKSQFTKTFTVSYNLNQCFVNALPDTFKLIRGK